MKRVSVLGVLVGLIVTAVVDAVISVVGAMFLVSSIRSSQITPAQAKDAVAAAALSPSVLVPSIVFGTLATIVGCYVAARIGKNGPYLNAAMVGVIGTVFGLAFAGRYPLWFNVASAILVVPAILVGARVAKPGSHQGQ